MKKLLSFILKNYLIPIIITFISVFIISSKKYVINESRLEEAYTEDIYYYQWIKDVDSVQGFIFGSSSLRYGLSSNMLSDSNGRWLNLSKDARDPVVFYLLLKKYFPLKKPKKVIVGLDPWIFTKGYYYHRAQLMYLDLNSRQTFRIYKKDPSVYFTKCREVLKPYLPHSSPGKPFNSGIPEDYGSAKLAKAARNFQKIDETWFEVKRYGWSEIQFDYLRRIKDFCKANGIELIFVIPPKRADYNETIRTMFPYEHKIWWEKINLSVGGEKVAGHFSDLKGYAQDSVFAEACHLNSYGQKVYSELLKVKLKDPGIISPQYDFN
jgi:hypothetical protein